MDKLVEMVLVKEIDRQFKEKENDIIKGMFSGCDDFDSEKEVYAKMICNAIRISTELSVGAIFDALIEHGIIVPKGEEELRKTIMSVVK